MSPHLRFELSTVVTPRRWGEAIAFHMREAHHGDPWWYAARESARLREPEAVAQVFSSSEGPTTDGEPRWNAANESARLREAEAVAQTLPSSEGPPTSEQW